MPKSDSARAVAAIKRVFRDREFMHYNPAQGMRVLKVTAKAQALAAAGAFVFLGYATAMTGMAVASPGEEAYTAAEVAALKAKVAALQNDVEMKAAVIEERQAFLAEQLVGDEEALPALDETASNGILAPLEALERRQFAMVEMAAQRAETHLHQHREQLADLGVPTARFTYPVEMAMGGPEVSADEGEGGVDAPADPRFRELFMSWKELDLLEKELETVPSYHPVERFTYTSGYGVRFDPFRGTTAMHQGVDMAGKVGEPIYAAGEGKVIKAGWSGAYGKMVEIDHGKGMTTRYAHMSRVAVRVGDHVSSGEKLGGMGSTGRSTGSHLHFEVRIDGRAVNPMPFLEAGTVEVAQAEHGVGGN